MQLCLFRLNTAWPSATGNSDPAAVRLHSVATIDDLKKLIISSLSYSPVKTRNREKMSRLLHELTEQILDWSSTAIERVNDANGFNLLCPDALRLHGL